MYCSIHASCSNAQGESRSSKNVEEVQTLGQVPEAPSNPVDFVHPSNTSVRLDLFMWNKQTCPVDYFIVSYRKENVSGILKKNQAVVHTMNTKTLLRFCVLLRFRIYIGLWCLTTSAFGRGGLQFAN